jgi:1,2-diacylglycerol 3-beta-glucosyltransferase
MIAGEESGARPPGARVLIVEDDALEALLIERVVSDLHYAVLGPVATGEAALELARRERPDLVLMDVRLQGRMSGVEAAERLREEQDCPCVFMTAYGDPEMSARMRRIAGFAVLGKPISDRIVELTLRQVLEDRVVRRLAAARPSQSG